MENMSKHEFKEYYAQLSVEERQKLHKELIEVVNDAATYIIEHSEEIWEEENK